MQKAFKELKCDRLKRREIFVPKEVFGGEGLLLGGKKGLSGQDAPKQSARSVKIMVDLDGLIGVTTKIGSDVMEQMVGVWELVPTRTAQKRLQAVMRQSQTQGLFAPIEPKQIGRKKAHAMALYVDACKGDNDLLESCECIAFCKALLGSRKQEFM